LANKVKPRAHLKLTVQPGVKAELEQRFKSTDDVRQRQRLQAVLLATTGQHGYRDIARIVGCATSTFALWLNRFLAGGIAGLLRRESPPGLTSPIAHPKVRQQLKAGLQAGRWRTAQQVAAWLQEAHGIKRAAKSLYRWLGKAGGALRVPRPCHRQQDPLATAAFRAEWGQRLETLVLPKDRPVKIWVADESRFGLHTQSRRCWALRGQRVVIPQPQGYEWEYVYGALEVTLTEALRPFWESPAKVLSLIHHWLRAQANVMP
jgi:transposase